MKSLSNLFVVILIFITIDISAQNVFPTPTGNVGIGTASPASKLHVLDNNRNYYVNRGIAGATEDAQGINYILLHQIFTNVMLNDHFVMGKITGIRGSMVAWNRKFTVEVNTASALNTNRGSIISYNEPTKLVTLTHGGINYLALEISNNPLLYNFSFTGYAQNETLQLVKDDDVTNIQPFLTTDPIGIQGRLGAGTTNPSATLHAHSQSSLNIAKFTYGNVPATSAFVDISNGTGTAGSYFACIIGRSLMPGKPLGIAIQGEAEDIAPIGNDAQFGAIVLDGRSKTATRLVNNNVLAINSYGINLMMVKADGSVGIGTTVTHGHKLAVNGSGLFTKVKVKAYGSWPDYVFQPDYDLPTLTEVENYISINHHLKDIPSQQEVQENGIDLGEMDKKLLQKIEELMLYTIAQQKQIDALIESGRQMKEELENMKRNSKKE